MIMKENTSNSPDLLTGVLKVMVFALMTILIGIPLAILLSFVGIV